MLKKTNPRVVIDARMVSRIPHGMSNYVSRIAQTLRYKRAQGHAFPYEIVFLVNREEVDLENSIQIQSSFLHPREWIEIPSVLKTLKADFYHSPSFSSLWSCPCPWGITIHDLNHLTFGNFPQKLYYHTLLKRFARKAARIMTVSRFSQGELSSWLKTPPEKIEIIPNIIERPSSHFSPSSTEGMTLKKYGLLSRQYFLCISNTKPHKNVATLLDAYQSYLPGQQEKWPLVLSMSELPQGVDQKPKGVQLVGGLSGAEMGEILTHAGGVLFPSLYEGFGLPPVEAAVVGTPIAVSQIPPHQEVLSDLSSDEVLWVHPKNREAWTHALEKIAQGELQGPSKASQEKILSRFSAERVVQSLDQLYRDVLGFEKCSR